MTKHLRSTVCAILAVCAPVTLSAPAVADDAPLELRPPQKIVARPLLKPLEDASPDADWHLVHMQLRGSMCPACLLELQQQIAHLPGVQGVNIVQAKSPEKGTAELRLDKFAESIEVIDEKRISVDELRWEIKQKDYNSAHVVDDPLGRSPVEEDLHLEPIVSR